MKYVWNDEWINRYESAWNIAEKVYASNISLELYNRYTGSTVHGIKYHYQKPLLMYFKGVFKPQQVRTVAEYMEDAAIAFQILSNDCYFIDHKLRFCSICARNGYHSFLHQLTFMDTCFIHRRRLVNLCQCNFSYSLSGKKKYDELVPFSCVNCRTLMPYPESTDGIVNKWKNTEIRKRVNTSKFLEISTSIKRIHVIDMVFLMTQRGDSPRSPLSKLQKEVLRQIFINGDDIASLPQPQSRERMLSEPSVPLVFMSKHIETFLIDAYGIEEYRANFYKLRRVPFCFKDENFNYNYDIYAAFYLISELQQTSYVDRIYPVTVGKFAVKQDSVSNKMLEAIRVGMLNHVQNSTYTVYSGYERQQFYSCNLVNELYKQLVKNRFEELRYALENAPAKNSPPDPEYIPYEAKNYVPYVIIETSEGDVLLY